MDIKKRLKIFTTKTQNNDNDGVRRESKSSIVATADVTQQSLQIWLNLPTAIRHDPSLASFQMEHDRLHG